MACEEVNDVNRAGGEPRNPGLLLRHLRTDTSGGKQTDSRENTDIETGINHCSGLCASELNMLQCGALPPASHDMVV
ncbi:unnamed protein product [Acanthocheilonema viteae]|uniref:Uncharacterized protein n=1 Tax=Acanthocheilonema viteae TaxID=6277 RepID=A0A498S9F8_ACAVI|nr:unnamed protein product [Acanthocheilonema viteae]